MQDDPKDYARDLHRIRSLLIARSLQERRDLEAERLVAEFSGKLDWSGRTTCLWTRRRGAM